MHYGRLLPADQKLCRNVPGVVEYNSREIHPTYIMCYKSVYIGVDVKMRCIEMHYRRLLPADQKLCRYATGVT